MYSEGERKLDGTILRLEVQKRGTEMVVRNWFPEFTISAHAS